ncbi:MAG: phosphate acetyltransferase, partial [Desulfoprunum sp.]|nr:phosphate acetyltransferase [Desulfoprunum sp.]
MSKNFFITSTEERSGKSAIVLGVMQMLLKEIHRVAFFRPIISDTESGDEDQDINLVLEHFKLDIDYEDTFGCTLREAQELINSGQQTLLHDTILNKYKKLEAEYDFILCEGTDYSSKDIAFESGINADIAANLGAPILLVMSARNKTAEELARLTQLSLDTLCTKGNEVLVCIINRAAKDLSTSVLRNIRLKTKPGEMLPFYAIPENPATSNPTVGDVKRWLKADIMYGQKSLTALVGNYVVAAMQIGNFLGYIEPDTLVITPGDRSDIILSSLASRLSASYPDISGIVLTGGLLPSPDVQKLIEGWAGMPVPILTVQGNTFQTIQQLNELYGRIESHDTQRIATALGDFSHHVPVQELRDHVIQTRSTRITPKMFEYALLEKAGRNKQRIVLPEGNCERVLQAADILLRRGVVNLTVLGQRDDVMMRAAAIGMDLRWIEIIDPAQSELFEPFVAEYMKLRRHKGILEEVAR